jgi:hypothetical protein
MARYWRVLAGAVVALLLLASPAAASTPERLITYTKQTSLAAGTYNFSFKLYDSPTSATALWSSGKVTLRLRTPVLVYTLGSGSVKIPASIDFSQQLYVRVVKTGPGSSKVIAGRERLAISPYALYGASVPPMSSPIVLGESAGGWRTAASSSPVTFDILGPDAFLSGNPAATNQAVAYSLPLTQPALVGGMTYKLSSVEYCVRTINAANSKVDLAGIYSDNFTGSVPLAAEATDPTDRTTVGCYAISAADGTARAYALVLSVALVNGATTGGIIVSGVRSTWVPGTAAVAPASSAPAADPLQLITRGLMKRLAF